MRLSDILEEYSERNSQNLYKPVAIGRRGIRFREDIYSKELAKDYSRNKLIFQNTLTVGMGSKQIDIGILYDDVVYSVSPAYHTYRIKIENTKYLEYLLRANNARMFSLYANRGSRQGKTLDLKRWLSDEVVIHSEQEQVVIVDTLNLVQDLIRQEELQLQQLDTLIKARFVEMFGGKYQSFSIGEKFKTASGGTPSKKHTEYYTNGTVPWLTSGEVNAGIIYNVKQKITEDAVRNSSAKLIPDNSVLVAMYGATAGQVGLLKVPTTTNQAVCSILPNKSYLPEFLYYAISSKKDWMIGQCVGGAQPNISQQIIRRMEIVDAPMDAQKAFVKLVHKVDKSKFAVQKSLEKTQQLFDSLMQEYFG